MKASCEMICGVCPQISCVTFLPQEGFDTVKQHILATLSAHEETLIIADLFGGTPFNVACAVAMKREMSGIEVLSGMSLALVLEAASSSDEMGVTDLAQALIDQAPQVVRRFVPEAIDEDDDF